MSRIRGFASLLTRARGHISLFTRTSSLLSMTGCRRLVRGVSSIALLRFHMLELVVRVLEEADKAVRSVAARNHVNVPA